MTAPAVHRWAATQVPLFEGAVFLLDGEQRRVVAPGMTEADGGRRVVHLARPDGALEQVPMSDLVMGRQVRPLPGTEPAGRSAPLPAPAARPAVTTELDLLDDDERRVLHLRLAHLLEAETGYRSGDPSVALPGEPKPQYDPALVPSVTRRRENKVAEIEQAKQALDPEAARRAGIADLSVRSLKRMSAAWNSSHSLAALVDRRRLKPVTGPRLAPKDDAERKDLVRDLIFQVEEDFSAEKSRVSVLTRHRRLLFLGAEAGLARDELPAVETYRLIRKRWFGSDGARMKYQRTNALLPEQMLSVKPTRPGQVVMLDTSDWDAKVRDGLFGDATTAKLTLAVDVYTRSIVAFRFTLTSDKSVDVAMVLRDVMMPMPMRPGWDADAEWPYPGVPANVVAEGTGYTVAGKPFFEIETATTDHGSVYANHHARDLAEKTGINLLPARKARGRDKAVVERMFGTIRQLLVEHLPGWRGVDVADRGKDPEADASMTLDEAHEYLAWFVTHVWQRRELGEHKPWFAPAGPHSPNSLFALSMAQGGWMWQPPDPDLYYVLLESKQVAVTPRGVKVGGLWYRDATDPTGLGVLSDPAAHDGSPAALGRKVIVKRDPRDCRQVFVQDPLDGSWHELRWTGLPPEDEFPAFSDATAQAVLSAAADEGIRPRAQDELLPLFYDRWRAAETSKTSRVQRAREAAQAQAAAADRQAATEPANARPAGVLALVPGPHDDPDGVPSRPLPRVERTGGDPLQAAAVAGAAADRAGARRRAADEQDADGAPVPAAPAVTARRRRGPVPLDEDDDR